MFVHGAISQAPLESEHIAASTAVYTCRLAQIDDDRCIKAKAFSAYLDRYTIDKIFTKVLKKNKSQVQKHPHAHKQQQQPHTPSLYTCLCTAQQYSGFKHIMHLKSKCKLVDF